jgi:drug/metabolite transporter (DMT)-like permease
MSVRKQATILLLINALIWGAAFPIVKPSLSVISPFQFLYFRYLIAAVLIYPVVIYLLWKIRPGVKQLTKIIFLELLGTPLALGLLYTGLSQTSAVEASLIASTYPLLITLGGIYFLKEREDPKEWLGLGLALVGTALLVLEPVLNGHQLQLSLKGNLLILAHNLVIAAYYLLAKRFYKGQSKLMVTGIGYWASLLVLGLTLKLQGVTTTLTLLTVPSVAVAAVYMGVFGSIIALTFYVKGQDLIEASEATLFSYLTGVFALPTAYFLLGETPTLIQLVAIVIIASGVILGQYHRK